ncbi:MAG TPA: FAD-binding oxidoreductase [candidate division WOR-3 bacterium]|uniref:FAD-binding oxidoreductase n=1 Tax=candidate division WOR-3 bacterium TaxID=2052148 RepID=A0A9C9JZD5_UNCW3|nr:FAD-binding oxidoreductase [candidate division WOR-3 bacterium]
MKNTADVIIIGGGIIGCATGYYLTRKGLKVYLFEKKYLTSGSTGRCIGGIRQQFSTELSIKVAMESMKKFKAMKDELGQDVEFHQGGYLFLAHSEEKKSTYLKLIELQKKMGLDVEYITVSEIEKLVPGINTEGLLGGAYCASDAQANPFLVVDAYAKKIKEKGRVFTYTEVMKINTDKNRITSITTADNQTYYAPIVVNAAGPFIRDLAKTLNLDIPIYPERHEAMITEQLERFFDMMIVDYRADGCYFNQKWGEGSIIGCYTPIPNVPGLDTGSSFEFVKEMGRRMARLIPKLENIKIIRQWSGSYEMTPDGNPILDRTEIEGFWIVGGMCGHGFMLGPEIGWLAAEYITEGKAPYDMSTFALNRDFSSKEVMK